MVLKIYLKFVRNEKFISKVFFLLKKKIIDGG